MVHGARSSIPPGSVLWPLAVLQEHDTLKILQTIEKENISCLSGVPAL